MSIWDHGCFISARSVTAWDQHPRGDNSTPETVPSRCTQETEQPGRCIRCTAHLLSAPTMHPVIWVAWTWEGHKMHSPSGSVPLQSTWEPEKLRPGKCTKCRAHLAQCPYRAPWTVSSVDLGSTHYLGLWQNQHCPYTATLPTHASGYLFAVSLPLHSTTEQVSLNKCSPSPPHVRAEIRHWRDLHAEEAKISKEKGITLEVTDATDWNPAVNAETVHLRGNYRLWEQLQPRTKDCLTLNWPHTAHNSSRQIPRYIFTIITF